MGSISTDPAGLIRCDQAWTPASAGAADLCQALEDDFVVDDNNECNEAGAFSQIVTGTEDRTFDNETEHISAQLSGISPADVDACSAADEQHAQDSSAAAAASAPSSLRQKSIATTAREDFEKMAAMATLAQQNSPGALQQSVQPSPWSTPQAALPVLQAQNLGSVHSFKASSPNVPAGARLALRQSCPSVPVGIEDLSGILAADLQGLAQQNMTEEQKIVLLRKYVAQQQAQAAAMPKQHKPLHVSSSVPPGPAFAGQVAIAGAAMSNRYRGGVGSMPTTPTDATLSGLSGFSSSMSTPAGAYGNMPSPTFTTNIPSPRMPQAGGSAAGYDDVYGNHNFSPVPRACSPALPPALAQMAAEHGVDPATLVSLLNNTKLLDMLNHQKQQMQAQHQGPRSPVNCNPSPTHMPRHSHSGIPVRQRAVSNSGNQDWDRASPSPANTAPLPGGGPGPAAAGQPPAQQPSPANQQAMASEFNSARSVLVQLMMSAYAFLNSDNMKEFFDKLDAISSLYDDMHDLPVVQKRIKCQKMGVLRVQLMKDAAFMQILQAVCALRHHLHTLSRKVLVMNQGPDGIPIDLLLGSMSSELYHLMKSMLPQDVSDFFGNNLPHPKLAVLVFAEFTSVDPMPTGA